jgi:hypothetical protein
LYSMECKSQSQHSTRGVQPTSVLLIGHSYIRRLGDYMRAVPGAGNLGFDVDQVTVHCFGQGGGSIRPGDPRRNVLNILSQALPTQPSVIFFHMGENDIGVLGYEQIASAIMSLSYYVSSVSSVKFFVCSELLPFPKFAQQFDCDPADVVGRVNSALSTAIEVRGISPSPGAMAMKFWHHECGFWSPTVDLFREDRVHLNDVGMERYFRSVRAAIGFALGNMH